MIDARIHRRMEKTNQRISVAMATYNGERFLGEQLSSLARQSHLPLELQVGDDGSTDRTLEILAQFARSVPFPVVVTRNAKNLGYGPNFMATARRCSGEWIAFCDQDDVWLPGKLARCAEIIVGSSADLLLVVHNATVTDENLTPSGKMDKGPFGKFPRYALSPHYLAHGYRQVFRRTPVLDFPETGRLLKWISTPDAHDNFVCVTASLFGEVISIDEELSLYRRHESTSSRIMKHDRSAVFASTISNNAEVYEQQGEALRDFSVYLAASGRGIQSLRDRAREASERVARLAATYERRAQLYRQSGRLSRLRTITKIRRSGGYSGRDGWSLGARSLLKDAVFAIAGRG